MIYEKRECPECGTTITFDRYAEDIECDNCDFAYSRSIDFEAIMEARAEDRRPYWA